jgi:hypothetical protein
MRDPVFNFVQDLLARGVALETVDGQLHWRVRRGVISEAEKERLAENAPIVAAILNPDLTLPDDLFIPADCPNNNASIMACIDSQRVRRAASEIEKGELAKNAA